MHNMRLTATDVARSVVCVSVCVCVFGTRLSCAITAEPIEMPFLETDSLGPKNHCIAKTAMRLLPNYFGNLFMCT